MVNQRTKEDTYLDNKADKESRYKDTAIFIDEVVRPGSRKYDIYTKPNINELGMDTWIKHTVTQVDYERIDNISYEHYGRSDFWWAIAQVNDIQNPLEDIVIGDILAIPPIEEIQLALGSL